MGRKWNANEMQMARQLLDRTTKQSPMEYNITIGSIDSIESIASFESIESNNRSRAAR